MVSRQRRRAIRRNRAHWQRTESCAYGDLRIGDPRKNSRSIVGRRETPEQRTARPIASDASALGSSFQRHNNLQLPVVRQWLIQEFFGFPGSINLEGRLPQPSTYAHGRPGRTLCMIRLQTTAILWGGRGCDGGFRISYMRKTSRRVIRQHIVNVTCVFRHISRKPIYTAGEGERDMNGRSRQS